MIRNIDIDILRAFLTIYESGSFSHAAERLGRTQSTISQQIKKLEDILGHDVFLRNNRSVRLTTEGEVLLSYARKMVALNDEVFGRISKTEISGTVKIGAPEAFATYYLPEILVQFTKSHPNVGLDVHCDLSHHLLEDFEKGNFDLVLVKRDTKARIHGNQVWHEGLVWAGKSNDICSKEDSVPLVLSPNPCVYRAKMIDTLEKGKVKWHAVFTSSSMSSRIAAAKAGLGITAVPKEMLSSIHGLVCLGEACKLPALPDMQIDMITNADRINDAVARLAEHIIFVLENNPSLGKAVA